MHTQVYLILIFSMLRHTHWPNYTQYWQKKGIIIHHYEQWRIQGGGATGANAPPFKKSKKISFKPFLKVFGPLQCFCVCHTTENDLVTCTRWTWAPTNPLTSRSLHKNTPLHLLWHFKVTHKEISSDSIRVILPMLVRGQLLILFLILHDGAE